ncbi:Uncharacterized protein Fot_06805 [Forsythia ovata]|uniref:Uncharacterized protein n=1 Tax=Forsythia ovata TaxID=205694 RepID=A0ABD1WU21_9LAMI
MPISTNLHSTEQGFYDPISSFNIERYHLCSQTLPSTTTANSDVDHNNSLGSQNLHQPPPRPPLTYPSTTAVDHNHRHFCSLPNVVAASSSLLNPMQFQDLENSLQSKPISGSTKSEDTASLQMQ